MNAKSTAYYRFTVFLDPQEEGGYTVTCEELPELVTEGDSVDEALDNAVDAFKTTIKLYENIGSELPDSIRLNRKERRRQERVDMRRFFETINSKPHGGANTIPYCFEGTLPTSDFNLHA